MINNSKHQIISSNIAPNPIEVKFWLDTNSDTLKTYKDGKWEAMTGGGSSNSSGNQNFLDITSAATGEFEPDAEGWYDISTSEWEKAKNFVNSPCSHVMIKAPELMQLMSIATAISQQMDNFWMTNIIFYMESDTQMGITYDSDHPNKLKISQ